MRRTRFSKSTAFLLEFVDPSFLNKKRPANPGGAWPVDLLRRKSTADLQQIWFTALKERNQLSSTKLHYLRHQEDLGAMPGPGRLKLLDETLRNIKFVVKERDFEATDQAVKIFRERLAQGVYRYPPGPQPPPGYGDETVSITIVSAARLDENFVRAFLQTPQIKDDLGGIASIEQSLPGEVLEQKRLAEEEWNLYRQALSDHEQYYKWRDQPSTYDCCEVELAPGVFDGMNDEVGIVPPAAQIPVPPPTAPLAPADGSALQKVKFHVAPAVVKEAIRFNYFPNNTRVPPPDVVPTRPTHPDEIEGPWHTRVTFENAELAEKALGALTTALEQKMELDGVPLLSAKISDDLPKAPYASSCPVFQEAVLEEEASAATEKHWPHAPIWKQEYNLYSNKNLEDIIQHNYTNVVDYVDREVVLTGRSVWEMPIDIDYSCGGSKNVPVFAKEPVPFMKDDPLPSILS